MGRETSIEWTDATLSLGWGYRKVDSACKNCYMFRISNVWRKFDPAKPRTFNIVAKEKELNSWKDMRLIFMNDCTDTFGEFYSFDLIEQWHQFFEGT